MNDPIILTYEQFRKQTEDIQNKNFEQKEPESTFDKKAETYLKSKGWKWEDALQLYVTEKKGHWYSVKQAYFNANSKQSLKWVWNKYRGSLDTANPVKDKKVANGRLVDIKEIDGVIK